MADQGQLTHCPTKPRVMVISDVANEPHDTEFLLRFLLYGNESDIQGLVACISCWMQNDVHPKDIHKVIDACAKVVADLNSHVHPSTEYPTPGALRCVIKAGLAVYSKAALKPQVPMSDGVQLLVQRVDKSSDVLGILCWGGTNVLAQALQHVQTSRSEMEMAEFCTKLCIYAISD